MTNDERKKPKLSPINEPAKPQKKEDKHESPSPKQEIGGPGD